MKIDELSPFDQMTVLKDLWAKKCERSEAAYKLLSDRVCYVIQHEDLPDGVRMALQSGLEQSLKIGTARET